jgi:hypothetical protein
MGTLIHFVGHGLVADDIITLGNLVGGEGLQENHNYYVLAAGLTANDFAVSETSGGAAVVFTTNITDGIVTRANQYVVSTDPAMAPPAAVPTPSAPTVTSVLVSGIVRLSVTLNTTPEAKVRNYQVQITHKYDGSGNPDWTQPLIHTMPEDATELTVPALGSTQYSVRVRMTDVYGNESPFSTVITHTTLAGSDALAAALAALANDVSDGVITETKIADNAISTPKLQAGAVTAQVLAATIVLASLIKTADSGRRIEVDVDGIRLYDTDESLLVRIPTNGDPVFVKGQVSADSLVSQSTAQIRGTMSLDGNSVTTLQNGIAAPSVAPTIVASVDSLGLTGTGLPVSAVGIGYDSGAGTFWVAVDPATGYVAYEYNATTGAFVRRIAATGSTTTLTATLGSTAHVSDTAQGLDGSTNSHITTPLTIPSGLTNVQVTKVAAYFAGHNGTCSARTGVWSTGNSSLRESATFTAADEGATGVGDSHLYNRALSSPLAVTSGLTYRFGFRHTSSSEGFQFDRDDGSGKTTYSGDGTTADGTGWGTLNSASKPNVYATYTYDVDTRLETAPMIGVATDGTYVYTLDTAGVVWKYDRTTMAHVAHSSVQTAITGTKSKAGLFYDATATELIITTTTGTGAGVFPKFVRVTPSTLAVSTSVYSAAAGTSFSGTTDTFRGGARLNDPLNANAATYWVATTSGVYAYTFSGTTATETTDRLFGQATTMSDGLDYDGTQFRGFDAASLTKIWKFTNWDWTTASAIYWFCYAWYDSAGTTHETAVGPRSSATLRRRERVQVQNPAIPTGGADDPNKVRIYIKPNATDPGAGNFKKQVEDALTSRFLTTYDSAGAADGGGTAFPSGTPAELKSAGTGFSLKGSGLINRVGTAFPASPATNDQFWRSDLGMEFFYNGTRWLSVTLFTVPIIDRAGVLANGISATTAAALRIATPPLNGGSDIWLVDRESRYFVNGGTALSASHKWVGIFAKVDTNNAETTINTLNIDSGSSSVWRSTTAAINALLTSGTYYVLNSSWTKTGTPGNLLLEETISYRIVAT